MTQAPFAAAVKAAVPIAFACCGPRFVTCTQPQLLVLAAMPFDVVAQQSDDPGDLQSEAAQHAWAARGLTSAAAAMRSPNCTISCLLV